jgi:hypothetical protein
MGRDHDISYIAKEYNDLVTDYYEKRSSVSDIFHQLKVVRSELFDQSELLSGVTRGVCRAL